MGAKSPKDRVKRQISVLGEALLPLVVKKGELALTTTKDDIQQMGLSEASLYEYVEDLAADYGFKAPRVSHYMGKFNTELMIKIPVGEHGVDWARGLTDATEAMYKIAGHLGAEATIAGRNYRGILNAATFQQNPMKIACEGSLTIAQTLALLTMDPVKGFEGNPRALAQAVTDYGLVNRLAARIPEGYVGPFSNLGYKFEEPVVSFDNGAGKGVKFSEKFEHQLREWVKERNERGIGSVRETGKGCPFARNFSINSTLTQSGVDFLTYSFLDILDLVYKDPYKTPGARLRRFIKSTRII